MSFKAQDSGWILKNPGFVFFFGNRESSIANLQKQFPKIRYAQLKQVHSAEIVNADRVVDGPIEADAHFSQQKNIGLVTFTADCVPILILDPKTHIVCAIHAGWRGVEKKILLKTISHLQKLGSQPENLLIALGPHIQFDSFEVGSDVKAQILSSISKTNENHFLDLNPQKAKVNLAAVLCSQLQEVKSGLVPFYLSQEDSFKSPAYHSFRRDSKLAGRQYSFVALLK